MKRRRTSGVFNPTQSPQAEEYAAMHEATAEPIPFPSRVAGCGDDPLTASRRRGARQLLAQAIGAGVAA